MGKEKWYYLCGEWEVGNGKRENIETLMFKENKLEHSWNLLATMNNVIVLI